MTGHNIKTADVDDLPPVQYLLMETLAARYRCGEQLWTFPSHLRQHLAVLETAGLVHLMHGVVPKTVRAGLTEQGIAACLSATYNTPVPTLAQAIDTLPTENDEYFAWMRRHQLGHGAGIGTVIGWVRHDLQKLLGGSRD